MINIFLMSGLSYILFLLVQIKNFSLFLPVTTLLILFSFPHFMATYWVWGKRWKSLKQEWWAVSFPLLYLCTFILSSRNYLGPLTPELILKISYLHLFYHFARQLYGVSLWMSKEHGISWGKWERKIFLLYFLVTGAYGWVDLEARGATHVLFYYPTSPWQLSPYVNMSLFILTLLLTLLVLVLILRRYFLTSNPKVLLPLLIFGLSWIWFVPPFGQDLVFYIPILHALQYFPFVFFKRKESYLLWGVGMGLCVFLGWFLFRWLALRGANFLVSSELWPAMILTLLNNHHFIIDSRIWKLEDPSNKDLFSQQIPLTPAIR